MPERIGVLLVHGIGEQKRGYTIFDWTEALAIWLDSWLTGAGVWHLYHGLPRTTLEDLHKNAQDQMLREYCGWLLERYDELPQNIKEKPSAQLPDWIGGNCHLSDISVEPDSRKPGPAKAALEIHRYRSTGVVESFRVQIAEAHWADVFPSPGFGELISWALQRLPHILQAHLAWGLYQARKRESNNGFKKLRFAVEVVSWYAASLLLPIFPPFILAMIVLSMPLALIPLGAAQSLSKSIRDVMVNIIGDSFTLLEHPASATAIRERVQESLRSLSECSKVIVAAHSQGAAISFDMLATQSCPNVTKLITFGSGARKLTHLRAVRDGTAIDGTWVSAWIAVAIPWFAVPFGLDIARGVRPSWISLAIVAVAAVWYVVSRWKLGGKDSLQNADTWRSRLKSIRIPWLDLYASADPVSNGEHVLSTDRAAHPQYLSAKEIHNRGSGVSDHTVYWKNTQQFLPRVAESIAESLGWKMTDLTPVDDATLAQAWLARVGRVSILRVGHTLIWASFVHYALSGRMQIQSYAMWCYQALSSLQIQMPGWLSRFLQWLPFASRLSKDQVSVAGFLLVSVILLQWLWSRAWGALDRAMAKEMFRRGGGMEGQFPLDLILVFQFFVSLFNTGGSFYKGPWPALLSWETLILGLMLLMSLKDLGYIATYLGNSVKRLHSSSGAGR